MARLHDVRPYQPGDEEAVLALHNRAFVGHPTRTRLHWNWKFRTNPSGGAELIVAMERAAAPRCLAVYAVVPVRSILAGQPCLAGLQTDMAVDPELRGGLGGSRLILEVGEQYMRTFLGGSKALEWGFPEPQLQRVCLAHLKVGILRDVCFLVREPVPAPVQVPSTLEVRKVDRHGAELDALWARHGAALDTATVRDARAFNWRYAEHPDVRYLQLEARAGGTLRGVAIARQGGLDERLLSIVDWFVPEGDDECEAALLAELCAEAGRRGRTYLATWFPLFLPIALRWQRRYGFFVRPTQLQESYRCWTPGVDRRWLDEHWYQTMGDIDSL